MWSYENGFLANIDQSKKKRERARDREALNSLSSLQSEGGPR